ncbi:MAG TPA: hypothetical protein VEJ20_03710, partial [Candidatus Eremiobacteraceae bacterium]|nr:hypothetical protein [Candidatus Eremiobacteraceae bacterium]
MSWGWLFKDGRLRPVLRAAIYTPAVLCALIFLGAIAYAFIGPSALMTPTPYPAVLGFAIAVGGAIIGAAIVQRIYLDRRSVASLGFAFRRGWLWLFGLGIAFGAGMQATVFAVERLTGVSHVVGFGTAAGDVRNL